MSGFKPWRTIAGEALADTHLTELQVMLEGVCQPDRFLDLLRNFIVFDDDGSGRLVKKMAGYHQFSCRPYRRPEKPCGQRNYNGQNDGLMRKTDDTSRAENPAGNLATAASGLSGTPRDRARA